MKKVFCVLGLSLFLCSCGKEDINLVNNYSNTESVEKYEGLFEEPECIFNDSELNNFITYTVDFTKLEERDILTRIKDYMYSSTYTLPFTTELNVEGLKLYCEQYNENAKKSENARIEKTEEGFILVPEIVGSCIDYDYLVKQYDDSKTSIPTEYLKPEVVSSDLQFDYNELKKLESWYVEYDNGNILTADLDYITYDNGIITVDSSYIVQCLPWLLNVYDTTGDLWDYITVNGDLVEVENKTWGSSVDYDKELEYVLNLYNTNTSENNRHPLFIYEREDLSTLRVEVDIENQKVYVIKDDILFMESDTVTGRLDKHDTPKGVYYLTDCVDGKYLRGADYVTWVDKWMKFTDRGHGLHDAQWRKESEFGGTTYKTNGSHGCVNLPKQFAYDLFDIAYVGMPVIIY